MFAGAELFRGVRCQINRWVNPRENVRDRCRKERQRGRSACAWTSLKLQSGFSGSIRNCETQTTKIRFTLNVIHSNVHCSTYRACSSKAIATNRNCWKFPRSGQERMHRRHVSFDFHSISCNEFTQCRLFVDFVCRFGCESSTSIVKLPYARRFAGERNSMKLVWFSFLVPIYCMRRAFSWQQLAHSLCARKWDFGSARSALSAPIAFAFRRSSNQPMNECF